MERMSKMNYEEGSGQKRDQKEKLRRNRECSENGRITEERMGEGGRGGEEEGGEGWRRTERRVCEDLNNIGRSFKKDVESVKSVLCFRKNM